MGLLFFEIKIYKKIGLNLMKFKKQWKIFDIS